MGTKDRPYVSWVRVSTKKQGDSGLGLEAQKAINRYFMNNREPIAEFVEVYSGTKLDRCTELQHAIAYAKANDAMLVIAKADRFRNAKDALAILDEMGEENIRFCDAPSSSRLILTMLFAVYEHQAIIGRINTKLALDVRKKQIAEKGGFTSKNGVWRTSLGRPEIPKEHILKMAEASAQSRREAVLSDEKYQNAIKIARDMRERGATLQEICGTLNSLEGVMPRRGGKWVTGHISRMLGNTID